MNLRKLAKASNNAQKQAARKSKEGKEEDIKDIKVDSKILIFNLFIHFYNWSKQATSRLLIIRLHVICFTAICRLASTRGDLPLISDSGCKKVKSKNGTERRILWRLQIYWRLGSLCRYASSV